MANAILPAYAPAVPGALDLLTCCKQFFPPALKAGVKVLYTLAPAPKSPCSALGNRRDWGGRLARLPTSLATLLGAEPAVFGRKDARNYQAMRKVAQVHGLPFLDLNAAWSKYPNCLQQKRLQ